jgi:uncharacterized membrane protein (DUF4010 family)
MHGWMNGGDWFWMAFMMVWLVAVLGVVIYVAVRLANRRPQDKDVS